MTLEAHSSNFTDHLISLRDQYQARLADFELKASHAREQLNHINALLVDQLVTTVEDDLEDDLPTIEPTAALLAIPGGDDLTAVATPTDMLSLQKVSAISVTPAASTESAIASNAPTETSVAEQPQSTRQKVSPPTTARSGSRMSLPLLAPYQGLAKIEAVQQLLQDNSSTPLRIDDIIQRLYGDLDKKTLKQERMRMRNTITRGKQQKLWQRAAGKEARFTVTAVPQKATPITTQSTSTKNSAKPKASLATKSASKKSGTLSTGSKATKKVTITPAKEALKMNPSYASKSLTEAVKKVMAANQGKVMTSRLVATALYPNLDDQAFASLKQPLNLIFSKGSLQGIWERVPNQKGAYVIR